MTGWTLAFEIIGASWCVCRFMKIVLWLDTPKKSK